MIIFVVSVILYNFAVGLDGFATAHRLRRHTLQAHSRILTDLPFGKFFLFNDTLLLALEKECLDSSEISKKYQQILVRFNLG